MSILVTGGAGYIGSHICTELLNEGCPIVLADNLYNSKEEAVFRIKKITGKDFPFYKYDLCNYNALNTIFEEQDIHAVIHLAGYKAVGESVKLPLKYYNNNLTAALNLLALMEKYSVKNLVFSSSATVYGDPERTPITEDFPLSTTNPYGTTKLMIEQILQDLYCSNSSWNISILRYFNPIGAHPSGLIGEDPQGIPNNLVPYITQVASGKLKQLQVFGNNYPTRDGTGVRDYIHVVDLAKGHLAALKGLKKNNGLSVYNLGTGRGYSVLEVVEAFQKVTGIEIPYIITKPRAGDVAECYADPKKAKKELGWKTQLNLEQMCRDAWNWQKANPAGYRD